MGLVVLLAVSVPLDAGAQVGATTQTYTGSLAVGDAVNSTDGSFQDDYTIRVEQGWVITATLIGAAFDPYVWILSPNQANAQQLGSPPGTHVVTLTHIAETSGSFTVRANSNTAGQTGDYTLQITVSPVRVAGVIQQGSGRADPQGFGFDHNSLATLLQQRIPQMTVCYEQGLILQPSMQGQLTLRFILMSDGLIGDVEAMPSGGITLQVANCIAGVVRALRLRAGSPQGRTQYTFPYTLRPLAQAAPQVPSQPAAPTGPPVRQYRGTVQGSSDRGLPSGTSCVVRVEPASNSGYNCRVLISCGGRLLYGDGGSGYNMCQADGSVSDARMDDGDPAMALSPSQGSVTVTSPNASYVIGIQ